MPSPDRVDVSIVVPVLVTSRLAVFAATARASALTWLRAGTAGSYRRVAVVSTRGTGKARE